MNPKVRDLYKRFVILSRDYPGGSEVVKRKAKEGFFKNANITDEFEINKAINYGRYMTRELIGIIQLKKYRSIKSRYVDNSEELKF